MPRINRRRVSVTLLAIAALGVAGTGTAIAAPAPAPAPAAVAPADVSAAAALTFADEFNGAAGTAPDSSKWVRETGGGGWGNQELEYYTTSTSNAALDGNGNLVITARRENPAGYSCWYGSCQYTSARLTTNGKFTQAYGRFEARIKIPRGQGMWPAFWMLGNNIGSVGWPNSGEIDIMENVGKEPNAVHGSLHGPGYSGGNPLTGTYNLGRPFADDFHTFAVDWTPGAVAWSVDGVQYLRHTSAETNGNPWVFDHPFFMILNVAVGGVWPGSPDGSTVFPQQMVIDYVRVYSSDSGGGGGGGGSGATGQITGVGGKCVDVAGANTANGTAVQLWDCNGTGAQRWTMATDGTVRALGKCLDVTSAGTANGTQVQLWDCNGSGAQQWRYTSGRDLVNPQANKCLDATGASSANGTRLQIWDCTGGANQKWTVPTG
ncbi:ricin-type beta-trefoil lectin domain protein [Planosporangium mesophilum]|nr:glycoside hydrolase family 16 protein [Planosporangium mesophilum]NJC85132.1 family 16 glycosylhydrolase [Planosporangium mesophilum]